MALLLSCWGFSMNAQELVYEKHEDKGYVLIKSEKHDSLMAPYRKQKASWPEMIQCDGLDKLMTSIRNSVMNQELFEKLKENKIGFSITFYIDRTGRVIDAYIMVLLSYVDQFDEEDFRFIYNQIMKQRFNMEYVRNREEFTYARFSFPWSHKYEFPLKE